MSFSASIVSFGVYEQLLSIIISAPVGCHGNSFSKMVRINIIFCYISPYFQIIRNLSMITNSIAGKILRKYALKLILIKSGWGNNNHIVAGINY